MDAFDSTFTSSTKSYSPQKRESTPERSSNVVQALGYSVGKLDIAKEGQLPQIDEHEVLSASAGVPVKDRAATTQVAQPRILKCKSRWDALENFMGIQVMNGRALGEGGYCKVYRCINPSDRSQYAVKSWKPSCDIEDQSDHRFDRLIKGEVSALGLPAHPNLVQTHAVIAKHRASGSKEQSAYILLRSQSDLDDSYLPKETCKVALVVSDFVNGMPLIDAMNQEGQKPPKYGRFSAATAIKAGLEIAKGLSHLHSHNVIHRDLKPENILFDGNTLKLIDFGLSKILPKEKLTDTSCGTTSYAAPEIIEGKKYGYGADVWSLGSVMLALATVFPPGECGLGGPQQIRCNRPKNAANVRFFASMTDEQKRAYFSNFFHGPFKNSAGLVDLLILMFREDPGQRIGIDEVVKHLEQLKVNPAYRLPEFSQSAGKA